MLAQYIRAQIALAGLALLVYTLVFWLMQLPYSFALSSVAGLSSYSGRRTFVRRDSHLGCWFLGKLSTSIYGGYILGRVAILQDYVCSPRIMGNKLKMHPLAAVSQRWWEPNWGE